jgi:Na+/H+ antiporter NhaD/arsenite permease-like protein
MLPVFSSLALRLNLKPELYMFGLLTGSCLGGNLTPFGASANIAAIGILKKEGVLLTFKGWLKIGLPFTLITTAAASIFLWFIWS